MDVLLILERLALLINPRSGNSRSRDCRGESKRNFRFRIAKCRARVPRDSHEGKPPPALNGCANQSSFGSPPEDAAAIFRFTSTDVNGLFFAEQLVVASYLQSTLPVKKVVTGIKTADLLLKAVKAVHGVMILLEAQGGDVCALGSPDGLMLGLRAAKVVFKGVKMSQKALESHGVKNIGLGDRFNNMMNGLKASWGALDVVRGSKAILSEVSSGRLKVVNLLVRGYEACKGAVNTVEVVGAVKVVGLVKASLSGVGVIIKAWGVSKALYVLVINGLGLSQGTRAAYKIVAEGRKELRRRRRLRSRVRFGRDAAERLVMQLGGGRKARVVDSLMMICLSAFADRAQSCSGGGLLSVQGL